LRIAILLIASVLVGSLVTAQGPLGPDPAPVIVQMSYYALQGREDEVLRLRLMAAEVLVRRGLTRGRVWRITDSPRATREPAGATVVWQGEFSNDAALRQYEQVADADPDFLAVRRQMGTVTIRTERRYYRETR
jgi:hypothetical protein